MYVIFFFLKYRFVCQELRPVKLPSAFGAVHYGFFHQSDSFLVMCDEGTRTLNFPTLVGHPVM